MKATNINVKYIVTLSKLFKMKSRFNFIHECPCVKQNMQEKQLTI